MLYNMNEYDEDELLHDDSIMWFGLHAGKCLKDIPDNYFYWFLKQPWCTKYPNLVKYAQICEQERA